MGKDRKTIWVCRVLLGLLGVFGLTSCASSRRVKEEVKDARQQLDEQRQIKEEYPADTLIRIEEEKVRHQCLYGGPNMYYREVPAQYKDSIE